VIFFPCFVVLDQGFSRQAGQCDPLGHFVRPAMLLGIFK